MTWNWQGDGSWFGLALFSKKLLICSSNFVAELGKNKSAVVSLSISYHYFWTYWLCLASNTNQCNARVSALVFGINITLFGDLTVRQFNLFNIILRYNLDARNSGARNSAPATRRPQLGARNLAPTTRAPATCHPRLGRPQLGTAESKLDTNFHVI